MLHYDGTHMTAIGSKLKAHGKRMTKARTALAQLFSRTRSPLSADDALAALKKRGVISDRTTVYRELAMLAKEGYLESSTIRGVVRYEPPCGHHHHLVCSDCGRIVEVSLSHQLDRIESALAQSTGFKNIGHLLEFSGVCPSCNR